MRTSKKVFSLLLAMIMVVGLLPVSALATGTNNVYLSVSYDGKYLNGQDGAPIAYVPVSFEELASIDLDTYGLSEYKYDENGDGSYDITALHMVIYAHENIYGGSWSDVTFTGSPGSSYFEGGIFGFDENLNYYLNGEYPMDEKLTETNGYGTGATSDRIVLEAGDFLDIASFSSWDFYADSNYGFHFFADESGAFTHNYTAEAGTAVDVKLVRSFSSMGTGATIYDAADYSISYGASYGNASGTVSTNGDGCAAVTFPSAGKWVLWADGGYGLEYPDDIVSAPAYAEVTVTTKEEDPAPEEPTTAQDVSAVLNATMAQLAATVTEPVFGTTAGEWTVLSLARGGYYAMDNAYFTDYYNRIVETVNETAASVNMSGALHKNKSTENSRLIVALSALGKDATSVGDWDLVEAYSANGFDWIKKQGLNGTIWALIALDSNNYATTDTTIRQQCVDAILAAQHDDGGWSLMANKTYASDPDITGMALTALYPYRDQAAVAEACAEAIACLSAMQNDDGTYTSGGAKCAESCSWVIVAATTWGINPDTDSRFIKNGNSVVDGLLAHYLSDSATFQHIIGAGSNAMATDQSCYALVAYDRFVNGKSALFNYSDVTFEAAPASDEMTATLGLPAQINPGEAFNGVISINKWDNEAKYKLIDFIVTVPEGVSVSSVTASERLGGGSVSYNLEEDSGKLRVVYFDANENSDLTVSGESFPAELFTIGFKAESVAGGSRLDIAISGMSVKLTSDSVDENAMIVVNTDSAKGSVNVVVGISFSAVCLYEGDGVDLIPTTKKAVAVGITGIAGGTKLTYNDGSNTTEFKYSAEITAKSGIPTYVALVDATIDTANFINRSYFTMPGGNAAAITFGDSNSDSVINAQDALAAVDAWLRKGEALTDDGILILNVNGDSRINTFDALGIVEAFVNGSTYAVVTKAATIATQQ
ncbi:MAG: hypothetical protein E7442_02955 [Ruminococcaceae bacterium]|nr:hypothetical protein [Oscillospiraceae bacterium]